MHKAFQVGVFFQKLLCFQANMKVLQLPLFHGRLIIIDSRWKEKVILHLDHIVTDVQSSIL